MALETEAEIRALLVELTGYGKPIESTTSVNLDVKIDGDDAYEFLEIIHKRFKTRFETLDWHMYFHDEPACGPFSQLKIFGYKENRRSLTFGKLLEAVQRGEWFAD
jgi:hypothetical protein